MAMSAQAASVRLLETPYLINHSFDYSIPVALLDSIKPGVFVSVPFGKSNKRQIGVVIDIHSTEENSLKSIDDICPGDLSMSSEMMELANYMQEQTLCTFGEAVHAMIPSGTLSKITEVYKLNCESITVTTSADEKALLDVLTTKGLTYESLRQRFGANVRPVLRSLLNKNLITQEIKIKDNSGLPEKRSYQLLLSAEDAKTLISTGAIGTIKIRSEKQLSVLDALLRLAGQGFIEEIDRECGFHSTSLLHELCRKKIVSENIITYERNPYLEAGDPHRNTDYVLNDEQEQACQQLCSLSDSQEPHGALLFGVTGSGKTCVIVRFIDHLLEKGKGVIVLLPEIALTPQSVSIFSSRYGKQISVIHSSLSAGERNDAFTRIKSGQSRIVIGTRSAVFAPVQNLGAIIIDEEQEHTYKSDNSPRYHARDIARYRCAYNKGVMLLASATPSIESYQKAMDGKYTLLKLTKRYGKAMLPAVEISDIRNEAQNGNITPIGTRLTTLLTENQTQHEQAILFLNRRGFNNFVSCPSCGEAIRCPRCSAAMTYHTNRGTWSEGRLVCHICGRSHPVPSQCPSCNAPHLLKMGFGTQRVEQELQELLPQSTVLRMDTDSTVAKFSVDEILGQFRNHEAQILLGTQMVTKGHDFPGVTLVGVLSADASLYLDDYRASERTFAMLTQVIGRAGRGENPGVALIQTSNPNNDVIKLACAQDYESFYEREIRLRKALTFPPFCDIALLTMSSQEEREVLEYSNLLASHIKLFASPNGPYPDVKIQLFGPFEAPIYRADNKYRMRIIIKCKLNKRARSLFMGLLSDNSRAGGKAPTLSIDFNPNTL